MLRCYDNAVYLSAWFYSLTRFLYPLKARSENGVDRKIIPRGSYGLFKNVFEWRVKMPVKGLNKTKLLALGAIFIYQLVLLYQYEQGKSVGKGIKALLRAA